jgi:hypothetical protein
MLSKINMNGRILRCRYGILTLRKYSVLGIAEVDDARKRVAGLKG